MKSYDTIFANGDSYTMGYELFDKNKPLSKRIETMYEHSFPKLLGKLLNVDDVINKGLGGGSDDRIVRTTYDYLLASLKLGLKPESTLVIIGLTEVERAEIPLIRGKSDGLYVRISPSTYVDIDQNRFIGWESFIEDAEIAYETTHNEIPLTASQLDGNALTADDRDHLLKWTKHHRDFLLQQQEFLINKKMNTIHQLVTFLQYHKFDYYIFQSVPIFIDRSQWKNNYLFLNNGNLKKYCTTRVQKNIYNQCIDKRVSLDVSMEEICKQNNIKFGSEGHPLYDGHILWAHHLLQIVGDLYG